MSGALSDLAVMGFVALLVAFAALAVRRIAEQPPDPYGENLPPEALRRLNDRVNAERLAHPERQSW